MSSGSFNRSTSSAIAAAFCDVALKNYDMSLGAGLSKVKGKVFRIGNLGHFNELMLMGTLSGVEMALDLANVPHKAGGVLAAMEVLKGKGALPLSTLRSGSRRIVGSSVANAQRPKIPSFEYPQARADI